ncbi:MAG: lipid A deacylase LpxR family protein [Helicobacteraceae bacterium]|nr:lipid A deacylase LpxR family protein [Helicobacteraceae bacterium]
MKNKLIALLFCLASTLHADQFSFQWYNDIFAGTDRHFTNGGSISWLDNVFGNKGENESNRYSALMFNIANSLPLTTMDTTRQHNAGISLYQMTITPTDITQTTPQYDDVPYTGYLALSFYLFEWDDLTFDEYRTDVGVVGPGSGAGWLQKSVHRLTNSEEPQGWGTQMGTKWTVNALYHHGVKSWQHQYGYGLKTDWFNHFGFQAGNFTVDGFGSTMWRIGQNYINNFNVYYPTFKEEAALLRDQKSHHGIGWSLSVGATAQLLAYSYILEEAKEMGYQLEKNLFDVSTYIGASVYVEGQKMTFFYQSQSPYIRDQHQIDSFGGFKFSLQF